MSLKEAKARARAEAAEEAKQDEEREALMEQRLRSWKRRTLWLGVALVVNIGAIAPFAEGQPLHQYAGSSTKILVYLAMCLLAVFMFSAGTSYVVWNYLRDIRKINKKFAPPGSKYRTH
jgi:hypothetical protein